MYKEPAWIIKEENASKHNDSLCVGVWTLTPAVSSHLYRTNQKPRLSLSIVCDVKSGVSKALKDPQAMHHSAPFPVDVIYHFVQLTWH